METYKSDKAEQPSPSLENLARRQHIAEQDLKDARLDIEYLKSAVEPKPVEQRSMMDEAFDNWYLAHSIRRDPLYRTKESEYTVWQACMEHYGVGKEVGAINADACSSMTCARILAMGTGELWERVALDVMQFEQTHEVSPIHAYGRLAYRGSGYNRYPAIAWRPSVRGDQCFMVIDKMQELGFGLELSYQDNGDAVAVWSRVKSTSYMLPVTSPNLKTAILQAALCAIHRV